MAEETLLLLKNRDLDNYGAPNLDLGIVVVIIFGECKV